MTNDAEITDEDCIIQSGMGDVAQAGTGIAAALELANAKARQMETVQGGAP